MNPSLDFSLRRYPRDGSTVKEDTQEKSMLINDKSARLTLFWMNADNFPSVTDLA